MTTLSTILNHLSTSNKYKLNLLITGGITIVTKGNTTLTSGTALPNTQCMFLRPPRTPPNPQHRHVPGTKAPSEATNPVQVLTRRQSHTKRANRIGAGPEHSQTGRSVSMRCAETTRKTNEELLAWHRDLFLWCMTVIHESISYHWNYANVSFLIAG